MTDYTAVNVEVQKLIDQALAADNVVDAAALQAALAADAAADAVVLKAKDDEIARLTAALAACQAGNPTGDTQPPSVPTGLAANVLSQTQITLTWTASTDNTGVTQYEVYRNGALIGTRIGTTYADSGLTAATDYSYSVKAKDAAGNVSAMSAVVAAKTSGTVTPPTGFVWPSAATTGAKGTLTKVSGRTVSAAGTVLENLWFTGSVRITGANVVMKNCKVEARDFWMVDAEGAKDFTMQDCTIIGPGFTGDSQGVLGQGAFLRNDISGCMHGLVLQGKCTVKSNFFHDGGSNNADPHIGGLSLKGGQHDCDIQDNYIEGQDTSCIFLQDNFGPIDNILINHNKCTGKPVPGQPGVYKPKPGYIIYVESRLGHGTTNVTVTNNELCKGGYGYFSIVGIKPTMSGNIDVDTRKPVT